MAIPPCFFVSLAALAALAAILLPPAPTQPEHCAPPSALSSAPPRTGMCGRCCRCSQLPAPTLPAPIGHTQDCGIVSMDPCCTRCPDAPARPRGPKMHVGT
ncbi:hypothetical protein MN608_07066 [Microdochium nivale]|nr:hypothetical protein MN608_07066 [Microdochium nivale]